MHLRRTYPQYVRPSYLGDSCTEAYYYFLSIKLTTYVSFPRMYLFFAIICLDMTYVLAKLGCLAPVLMTYITVSSARA